MQWMLAIWSLVPLPFPNPAWTFGSSQFTHCWSLAWGILSITLLECEVKKWSEVAQPFPTLCDPMDCSLPGSFIHGVFQARVLEWVAISFSRGSSWPRDRAWVSRIPCRNLSSEPPGKTNECHCAVVWTDILNTQKKRKKISRMLP